MSFMQIFQERTMQGLIMEVKCGLHATHWHVVGDHLLENTMIWQDNNPFRHL